MENKLNVPKLEYKTGEPMWVHWDNRYVLRGGHILGKCPDENLITTVGYLAYMDDKSIILGRGIENHCDEDGTRRVKDTIFTSSSWWSTPVRSDVFPLTETESYYKQQSPNLV